MFQSYLVGRRQFVRTGSSTSSLARILCGVPQRSVRGPIVFLLYTADLLLLIEGHDLCPHLYADDTQVYGLCRPNVRTSSEIISTCIDDVARWMRSNRFQVNTAKTEFLKSTWSPYLHLLTVSPIEVGIDQVMPVSIVRNLGIYMDADVSMRSHVSKTVVAFFAILRQLWSIRRSVPRSVLQSLVSSLVLQRFDPGNATLAGIPSHLTKRMLPVLNCAAPLVFSPIEVRPNHATPDTVALAKGSAAHQV